MVDRSRPNEPAAAAPVVLCCAQGEGARLTPVVDALRVRGHVVELLEGVDLEPRVLAAVIDNWRGGGLYVLCRGGSFDRTKIDAVREILLARRVPFGRTLTLAAADTDDMLERIDQSLRRMVAHLPAPPAAAKPTTTPSPDEAARQRRPTLMVTPPPPAKPATPPPPVPAASRPGPIVPPMPAPAGEPAAPSPSTARPSTPPAAPRPPAPVPVSAALGEDGEEIVTKIDPPRPDTSVTAMEVDAELLEDSIVAPIPDRGAGPGRGSNRGEDEIESSVDLDGVLAGIGDTTMVAPAPMRSGTLVAEAIPFEGYREDDVEIGDVTQVAPLAADGLTQIGPAPTAPPSPPPMRTVVATVVEGGEPSRLRFGIAAVLGSLAIGIVAAIIVSGDEDPPTTTAQADDAPAKADGEPNATPDAKPDAKPEPKPDARPDAEPDADPDAKANAEPDAKANAAPDSKSDAEPDTTPDGAQDTAPTKPTVVADTKPVETPDPTKVAAAKPERPKPVRRVEVLPPPRTRVLKALRDRKIRALDILLVSRKPAGPMPGQAAADHCGALDIDGIGTWRLPEIGELASLTDAGLVGGGYYWSGTPADTFGDARMVWHGARRQTANRQKPAAVICVRGGAGA